MFAALAVFMFFFAFYFTNREVKAICAAAKG